MGPVCPQHALQASQCCVQAVLPAPEGRLQPPSEELQNGAHMEIRVNGDLSTLYWRQNGPWDANTVPCRVTYGTPLLFIL